MSAPTSYVICHKCKEVTSITAIAEIQIPATFGRKRDRRKKVRAFVCRVCLDLEYMPAPK